MAAALLTLLFLVATTSNASAEVAAHTDFVHGLVTAAGSDQAERTLLKGAEVFDRDTINTADGARAQLRFSDGGLVSLLPNSTFSVEEYRLGDSGGEDGSLVFSLLRGGLRTVTGAIGKTDHDNYQLKTPVGTLGIRGTEFIAVIDPPGTLRVHVGRGKVVLSNQYGTLEVPEDYNAIMTLDEAPRLTEQGPVYMATGPNGDLRVPAGMVRSDPYNLDLPLFAAFSPGNSFLQSGPGYYMGVPGTSLASHVVAGPNYAEFDTATGALTAFLGDGSTGIDLSGPTAAVAVVQSTVAGLNWGVLSNGDITAASPYIETLSLTSPQPYLPYIVGQGATAPLTGTLAFSLPAGVAPAAYANTGAIGTLTQFDLGIDVGALTYTLDMALAMQGISYGVATSTVNPPSLTTLSGPVFTLNNSADITLGGNPCTTCNLNVSGFVTTSGSAGVTYALQENTTVITGVAPLVPPSYTPPASGTGGGGPGLGI